MRTVHKFSLNLGETVIDLPLSAKPIYVGEQFGELQLWVETTPGKPTFPRSFRIFSTGHPIDDLEDLQITHVGSAIMQGGTFLAHVYQAIPDEHKEPS